MIYDPNPLGGWRLLRSMIPPWGDRLNNPLLHYEVNPKRRAGGRPWGYIIVAVLMAVAVIAYFAILNLLSSQPQTPRDMVETTLFILLAGLASMSILGTGGFCWQSTDAAVP